MLRAGRKVFESVDYLLLFEVEGELSPLLIDDTSPFEIMNRII